MPVTSLNAPIGRPRPTFMRLNPAFRSLSTCRESVAMRWRSTLTTTVWLLKERGWPRSRSTVARGRAGSFSGRSAFPDQWTKTASAPTTKTACCRFVYRNGRNRRPRKLRSRLIRNMRDETENEFRVTDKRRIPLDPEDTETVNEEVEAPNLKPKLVQQLEAEKQAAERKVQDVQARFERLRQQLQ